MPLRYIITYKLTSEFVLTICLRIHVPKFQMIYILTYILILDANTFCLAFQVRFTGYRDRPLHERQTKFICALREGHTEIVSIFLRNFTFKKYKYTIFQKVQVYNFHENTTHR